MLLFHFPHIRVNKIPGIKWQNFKIAKSPQNVPKKGLLLGHNVHRGKKNTYQRISYEGKGIQAHRLVWIAFNGLIPYKIQINHKDGVKSNNHPGNLELATNGQNVKHAYDIGLNQVTEKCRINSSIRLIGDRNINSKISDEEVVTVRKLYRDNKIKFKDIQNQFNMSRRAIENMLKGKSYSHLPFAVSSRKLSSSSRPLDKQKAENIRDLYATKNYTQVALGKKFGVSRSTIRDVLSHRIHK